MTETHQTIRLIFVTLTICIIAIAFVGWGRRSQELGAEIEKSYVDRGYVQVPKDTWVRFEAVSQGGVR